MMFFLSLIFSLLAKASDLSANFIGHRVAEVQNGKVSKFAVDINGLSNLYPRDLRLHAIQKPLGKYVILIADRAEPPDKNADPDGTILAVLDLRNEGLGADAPQFDCNHNINKPLMITIGTKWLGKDSKKYHPIKAWELNPKNMHFESVETKEIVCSQPPEV